MANGGTLGERQIMGDAAYTALHAEPVQRNMMSMNTTFTQGGLATFPPPSDVDAAMDIGLNRGREGFVAWVSTVRYTRGRPSARRRSGLPFVIFSLDFSG